MTPAEYKRPLKSSVFLTGPPGVGKTTLLRAAVRRLKALPNAPLIFGFYIAEVRASPVGPRLGYDVRDLTTGTAEPLARLDDSAEARGPDYGPRVGRYRVRARAFDSFASASLASLRVEKAQSEMGQFFPFSTSYIPRSPTFLWPSRPVAKLFIADEVGAFESHSPMFARRLRQLLDGASNARRRNGTGEHLPWSMLNPSQQAAQVWLPSSADGLVSAEYPQFRSGSEDFAIPPFDKGGVVFGTVALKSGGALAGEIRARKDVYLIEVTRANRDFLLDHVVSVLLCMLANRGADFGE